MHGLFFDVLPKPGHLPHYFAHVDRLKPVLARHEGLLFLDRYSPRDAAEALLSHQLWRDEAAITAWRADSQHRASQSAGRRIHFDSYRIRVGPMIAHATAQMRAFSIDTRQSRLLVVAYGPPEMRLAGARVYDSVNHAGESVALCADLDAAAAIAQGRAALDAGARALRVFAITRDYTLTDRAEAPAP